MKLLKRKTGTGVTLVEVMIASILTTMVVLGVMYLMRVTAREQRVGFSQHQVIEYADRVQDRLTSLMQGASREAGIFFSESEGAWYRKMVFREAIGQANQELYFDSDEQVLVYLPDRNNPDDKEYLGFGHANMSASDPVAKLLDVRFRAGMKTGGIPDSGVILVEFEVADMGRGRLNAAEDGEDNMSSWIISTRTFAINLRRS